MSDLVAKLEKDLREIKAQLEKLKTSAKSAEELVPLQEKLGKIDSMQKDGKWVDEKGNIPPGQAVLHELLDDCYDLKDVITDKLG